LKVKRFTQSLTRRPRGGGLHRGHRAFRCASVQAAGVVLGAGRWLAEAPYKTTVGVSGKLAILQIDAHPVTGIPCQGLASEHPRLAPLSMSEQEAKTVPVIPQTL